MRHRRADGRRRGLRRGQHDVHGRRQPHREIATLRALGFGSFPVVFRCSSEASLLSLVGGLIGGAGRLGRVRRLQTSTMNFQSFSQVAFAFAVTPSLLARGSSTPCSWARRRPAAGHSRGAPAGRHGAAGAVRALGLRRSGFKTPAGGRKRGAPPGAQDHTRDKCTWSSTRWGCLRTGPATF